jgi:hypothetical protein
LTIELDAAKLTGAEMTDELSMLLGRSPEEKVSKEGDPKETIELCNSAEDLPPNEKTILEDTTGDSTPEETDAVKVALSRLS